MGEFKMPTGPFTEHEQAMRKQLRAMLEAAGAKLDAAGMTLANELVKTL